MHRAILGTDPNNAVPLQTVLFSGYILACMIDRRSWTNYHAHKVNSFICMSPFASCCVLADPPSVLQLSTFLDANGWFLLQTPYIHFMRMLFAATSSHPMIVLEFRHVSMRLCFRAGEVDHAAHAVAAIVQLLGFKEACVVGHSFGTFVASRLCQLHPSLVQSLVRF